MKTIYKFCSILTFLILCIAVSFNASAEDFEFQTFLVREVTKQVTPAAAVDCDGNSTPATPIDYTANEVLKTPDDFTQIAFRVYYSDDLVTPVYNFLNLVPTTHFTFDATSGKVTYVMVGIAQTRKKLTARIYLNGAGTGTPFEEKEFYTSQANTNPPIGTIIPFYGTAATAATLELGGWFLCDGRTIASISDDVLFTAEKTALQTVIGSASLPDLRGLFLRGTDPLGTHDPTASRAIGNVQASGLSEHSHNYDKSDTPTGNHSVTLNPDIVSVTDDGTNQVNVAGQNISLTGGGNHSHSISYTSTATSVTGTGINTETRPVNAAVNYLIKVRY